MSLYLLSFCRSFSEANFDLEVRKAFNESEDADIIRRRKGKEEKKRRGEERFLLLFPKSP